VNAEALQRALGLDGPVIGSLFAPGARSPGARVERGAFRSLLIETELGFRAARRIDAPLAGAADLEGAIATVAPMFELADPGFARVPIRGTDMIAANAACGGFVAGPARPFAGFDLDGERVRLLRDGAPLHDASSSELMGAHAQALLWLVNAVIGRGLVIEPGHLLMTGALGGAHPGAPGRYSAEFSTLGRLEITVI
jgi:2-keto-4-pentenoate hydratase